MLLTFFDVPIRSSALRSCCFLLLLRTFRPLFELRLQSWILVLPVSNGSRNSDNTLNSSIIDKASRSFNSLHFSSVIRLVIVTELSYLTLFIYQNGT